MKSASPSEETIIGVTAFKAQCLALIDDVRAGNSACDLDEAQSPGRSNRAFGAGISRAFGRNARQREDRPRHGPHPADRRGLGGRKLRTCRPVLLDTCAALWLMNGDPISPESHAAISEAQAQNAGVFVSPITAWEIGTLVSRNRIQLTQDPEAWLEELLELPGVRPAPMPPNILIASNFLPGPPPGDPAGRIIAATARAYGYAVISRDGELSDYAGTGHVDFIAC